MDWIHKLVDWIGAGKTDQSNSAFLLSPRNVIDAIQREGNRNQIESLRRKMTTIGNGHVGVDTT